MSDDNLFDDESDSSGEVEVDDKTTDETKSAEPDSPSEDATDTDLDRSDSDGSEESDEPSKDEADDGTKQPKTTNSQTALIVVLIVLIVALLAVGGFFAYKYFSKNGTGSSTTTAASSATSVAATLDDAVWDDPKWETTVAATVNGTEIPESKVVQYFKGLREANSLVDDVAWANYLVEMNNYYASYQGKTYSIEDLRSNILEGYIQWELVAQDAASKNITVSDDDVTAKIDSWKEQYGYTDDADGWKSFLSQNGYYSEDDFAAYVRTSLLLDQLVKDQVDALDVSADMDEVQNYADTYAQYYVGKQSSHILFDNEADAKTELEKLQAITDPDQLAATFAADASTMSKDTTYEKDDTGDVGTDSVNKISDEYTAALDALSVGQLSDVVKDDNGYHIILCTGDFELPTSTSESGSTSTSGSSATSGTTSTSATSGSASASATSGSTSASSASASSATSSSTSGSSSASSSTSATTTHVDLDSLPKDVYDLFYNASYQSAYNTAAQQVYTDYVKSLEDAADIVINDMPADAPYVVDMSLATEEATSVVASSATSGSSVSSSASSTSASTSGSTSASKSGSASASASGSASASSSSSVSSSAKSSK